MEQYNFDKTINPNKVFVIKRGELEGRLEAEYYKPEIRNLENHIRGKATKRLKHFIVKIASGATPSITEDDKYYIDKENGVPFLRVQNLQTNGKVLFDEDVKYINQNTHQTLLKRSQVGEFDLLIKITGVGRMAIASVAPKEFIGNTNQHMVVIKTKSREISEYLSNYLNLDLTEKLATRRSTGATRPALDYQALKSIPIIEGIDFSPLHKAELLRNQKEIAAQNLLDGIDKYLLEQLGIKLPHLRGTNHKSIFLVKFSDVTGGRLDANFNSKYLTLINQKGKYGFLPLKDLLVKPPQYGANEVATEGNPNNDVRYIRITDIDEYGNLKRDSWKTAMRTNKRYLLNESDILFARSGSVGRCYIHKETNQPAIFAGYLIRFVINRNLALPEFLFYFCNSSIYKFWVSAIERPAVQSNINSEEFKSLPIPMPPLVVQEKIVKYIEGIRMKAKELREEGNKIFIEAKLEIEKQIIN